MNREEKSVATKIPRAFLLRRLHSLLGFWITGYLLLHLFINSQASLIDDVGKTFSSSVNFIHTLPSLIVIEIVFLAIPFVLHAVLGFGFLLEGKMNSFPSNGARPSLVRLFRNQAYSFQRITAWILLVALSLHVIQMRYVESPEKTVNGWQWQTNKIKGLDKFSAPLNFTLEKKGDTWLISSAKAGPLFFLEVREIFSSAPMALLYSIFVIAAAFHGFNGFWTFLITWGVTITKKSQNLSSILTTTLMLLAIFFGLIAIWGLYFSYWI